MTLKMFRRDKITRNTEKRKDREPVFKMYYRGACYEVFSFSEKECCFSKKYRPVSDITPDYVLYSGRLPAIEKERNVPMAYLDYLCAIFDSSGLSNLCRRVNASDRGGAHILTNDISQFQVVVKRGGVDIVHSSDRDNYTALDDKQIIQEIKSLLFDIDLLFDSVLDMSDDQLVRYEETVSEAAADYWSETR